MATDKSLAIRREQAIARICKALGVPFPYAQGRDPLLRLTLQLEALADAAEAKSKAKTKARDLGGDTPPDTKAKAKAKDKVK